MKEVLYVLYLPLIIIGATVGFVAAGLVVMCDVCRNVFREMI